MSFFPKYLLITLLSATVVIALHLGLFAAADPLKLFGAPSKPALYSGNIRLEAAGIIRHESFDSAILGTSTSVNYPPALASELWAEHFVNLSEHGMTMHERALLLGYLLDQRPIKSIILSLDFPGQIGAGNPNYPLESYAFLYNSSRVDDLRAYFGYTQFELLVCQILRNCSDQHSIDELSKTKRTRLLGARNWLSHEPNHTRLTAAEALVEKLESRPIPDTPTLPPVDLQPPSRKALYDRYVLSIAKKHPTVRFHLLFPPHSRLYFSSRLHDELDGFAEHLRTVRYFVAAVSQLDNVVVHGMETLAFLDDSDNYYDTVHFSPAIAETIVQEIASGRSIIDQSNLDDYLKSITRLASNYDYSTDVDALKQAIATLQVQFGLENAKQ